jgi:pimeloyl-ACP methyl ester carboxylesterase
LRRAGIVLFVAIGLYAGLIVALAYLFLHPLRFGISEKPDALGLRYEEVQFPSATDRLTLHGWYLPADNPHPRGLIVFCHGRQGNRSNVLTHAAYLHKAGYALFAFDFRACGDSDGTMSTIGFQEVGDALGAVAYLEKRPDTRTIPLGIFGVSMGAAVALQTAAKAPEIRCVVADSPFATLDSAVRQRFYALFGPSAVLLRLPVERVGEQMMGADALSVSPLAAIPQIAPRPILLIHGDEDKICDVDDSRALYRAAAPGTAQLWIVKGAGHVGSFHAEPKEYRKRLLAFFGHSFPIH